jgi:aspartokinase
MKPITMLFAPGVTRDSDALRQVGQVLLHHKQDRSPSIALVSALDGVTPLLAESLSVDTYQRVFNKLLSIHSNVARKMVREEHDRSMLIQDVTDILDSYRWLGRSMINRGPTLAEAATVLAIGERLSARLLAGFLQYQGAHAALLDAHTILMTDDTFHSAHPDIPATQTAIRRKLAPVLRNAYIPVMGAAGGGTSDGKPTRLPADRGAVALAQATESSALHLWLAQNPLGDTSQGGMILPDELAGMAPYLPDLPPLETLKQALDSYIPVVLRGMDRPLAPGIQINNNAPLLLPGKFRAVIAQEALQIITLNGLTHQSDHALNVLAEGNIRAVMARQGRDKLVFFVPMPHVQTAVKRLEQAFGSESVTLNLGEDTLGLLTLFGAGLMTLPDLARQIESRLEAAGIAFITTVWTTGQPEGDFNLSVIVEPDALQPGLTVLQTLI